MTKAGYRLVIVESPAKSKTIQRYLGPGYEVDASVGHIRDLPGKGTKAPEKYKDKSWYRLAVDVDGDFTPIYVVPADKRAKVAELKKKLEAASELLLATDEDREGEAIAWHLLQVLKPKVPVQRMVFNEITPDAIKFAAEHTRSLDDQLVDAQETRRVLDRLYGYEVSPVLWKKVMPNLSAGRVQSVALRLVVERERERMAFGAAEYWDIEASLAPGPFNARLVSVDGRRIAAGKDFDDRGQLRNPDVLTLDAAAARQLADALTGQEFEVTDVTEKPSKRSPAAPFTTSTLQQEASRKLRWGAQRMSRVAQGLYERGYITYIRTDSTVLSATAVAAARSQAADMFGSDHVAATERRYANKAKNAQEAHEAIRPAGDVFRTPADVAGELVGDDFALYDLIWKRTLASQMADAKVATTTVRIGATAGDGRRTEFSASGTVVVFAGFLAAYEEGTDDEDGGRPEGRLPIMRTGDPLDVRSLEASGHETKPPARYTEASLTKQLEERGIGRPSTYPTITENLVNRDYVMKRGSALVPTWLGFSVIRLLEANFGDLVDFDFTARMEEILDLIATGREERVAVLKRFYFGDHAAGAEEFDGLLPMVERSGEIDARANASFQIPGSEAVVRVGRYGPYLLRGEDRANLPLDIAPDELTAEKAEELLSAPTGDHELGPDPDTGRMIVAKSGRYGPYVTEVLSEDEAALTGKKKIKPRTASLFSTMTVDTVDLEQALRLLSQPRVVGNHPEDGEPITAQNGRYGPYLVHVKETRSLPNEEAIFDIELPEALTLLAQPKQRRGRTADPGKPVGTDPNSGGEILLKSGRFGPYVTDGETNASLRRADDPETITLDRAVELLAERRAAGPPKKRAKKTAAKKTAGKKAPAKKAAAKKSTPAKKTAAKKATPAKKALAKKASVSASEAPASAAAK